MPKPASVALALAMGLACLSAGAQEPGDPPEVVRITGVRAIPWKSYRAMRAGLAAYEKYKALAPDATFSFGVALPGARLPANFAMRVRTRAGKEYPVTMDGKLFRLPILPDDDLDADLVTNQKGFAVKVGIKVQTAGVPLERNRLGDLRLTCQIDEAIDRIDEGLLDRLLAPDRCTSPKKPYWITPPFGLPAYGATLVDGARTLALPDRTNRNGTFYRVPLFDKSWSDDAIVEFDYTQPFPAEPPGIGLRYTIKN